VTDASLASRSRPELAVLVREYLLAGHLVDRAGMPHVVSKFGRDAMRDVAIDEWIGASPVYTQRIQRLLGIEGDDVATIFKSMQFDIGAPHQFMDFRYRIHHEAHGEFWLDHCGALMDVEPLGDEFVTMMCHHIEDPTFDATAAATNPRARMRPVHRPPRHPADREPHCLWTVTIEAGAVPLPMPDAARQIERTEAAQLPLPAIDAGDGAGANNYAGPFDPDLRLENFSHSALLAIADEVCLQGHLLTLSFGRAVAERFGDETAVDLVAKQFIGIAGAAARRIQRALGLSDGLADLAVVLDLHPAMRPRSYVNFEVENGDRLVVRFGDGPANDETTATSWPQLVAGGDTRGLDSLVRAIDPRARCQPLAEDPRAFEIVRDDLPATEAPEVTLTRMSTGADFAFVPR
jgi:hypothetical protein